MKSFIFIILSLLFISSFQSGYDTQLSEQLWKASSAAYQDASNLKGMKCGQACDELKGYKFNHQYTSKISNGESVSYSVFVNPDTKKVIFAFRGTDGGKQLMNEVAQSRAATYNLHNVPNAVATGYFYNKYKDNLRGDFLNQVKDLSKKYPGSDFYFTGHSLGGAFTSLGALDASMSNIVPKNKVHLYTYGSPRVGDVNLAEAINKNVNSNYRVVHQRDIVPHVPPCITDFKGGCAPWKNHWNQNGHPVWNAYHTGTEVFYNDDKNPKNYKICSKPEDPGCSKGYKLLQLRVSDHGKYLGSSTATTPHVSPASNSSSPYPSTLHKILHKMTHPIQAVKNATRFSKIPQSKPVQNKTHLLSPLKTRPVQKPGLNQTHPSNKLRIPQRSNQTHKPHSPISTKSNNSTHIRPNTPIRKPPQRNPVRNTTQKAQTKPVSRTPPTSTKTPTHKPPQARTNNTAQSKPKTHFPPRTAPKTSPKTPTTSPVKTTTHTPPGNSQKKTHTPPQTSIKTPTKTSTRTPPVSSQKKKVHTPPQTPTKTSTRTQTSQKTYNPTRTTPVKTQTQKNPTQKTSRTTSYVPPKTAPKQPTRKSPWQWKPTVPSIFRPKSNVPTKASSYSTPKQPTRTSSSQSKPTQSSRFRPSQPSKTIKS